MPGRDARGYHAGILQAAQANRQIVAAVEQVECLVGQGHFHPQLRMALHEIVHQGHYEALAVGHSAGQAQ